MLKMRRQPVLYILSRLMGIEDADNMETPVLYILSRLMGIEDADNEETACIIANLIYESKIKVNPFFLEEIELLIF